jgi:hypothetical protein
MCEITLHVAQIVNTLYKDKKIIIINCYTNTISAGRDDDDDYDDDSDKNNRFQP